ncbi:hypothetical protein [Caulobacter segnis]|uniref:hypothetical protein n=1 Tax=Caulobacter segnis TaxID=88688 RepID=UPI001CC0CF26|nr:hypothetical protein [Caulobacter segnis]UAL10943.1 hypothetical protein K8940_01210 [Caulobacter segnis]
MRRLLTAATALAGALVLPLAALAAPTVEVSFPKAMSAAPLDGRLLLLLSNDPSAEPRTQIWFDLKTQMVFGQNVQGLAPGAAVTVDDKAFGWPVKSLSGVKPGKYRLQVVLNRYETFKRSDGSVVSLPPDQGEGQHWNTKPGNLYSTPVEVEIGANGEFVGAAKVAVSLDQKIPEIARPADTPYIKHVRIKSELLSKFWGRPMYLGAHVLIPEGFETHPNARYPLMVFHGHYPDDFGGFRTTPPDPDLKPDYSDRFHLAGYNRIQQQEAYDFYRQWTGPNFPRFLAIEIEHANPYYDDSYAVNSANLGPYGDAINKELIPAIEKQFRGIGQGWARFTYGGSTGGWEALATQVFYPDMYNGAFAACPDPISFRQYTTIDLYRDDNAYVLKGANRSIERAGYRNYLGEVFATQRDVNTYELALGDRGRSGEQYDIWQAVYGPQGPDGYPKPIFDKVTGQIDRSVADYWREHYDLTHIIQRDWKTLWPKLQGKIHVYVGRGDNYFLNNSVYVAEEVFNGLKDPPYGGEVAYGDKDEHCWNGAKDLPNAISRLRYNTIYLPKILKRIEDTAPPGADLKSWRY